MTTTEGDKMKNMGSDFRARYEAALSGRIERRVNASPVEVDRRIKGTDPRIIRYTDSIGRGTR